MGQESQVCTNPKSVFFLLHHLDSICVSPQTFLGGSLPYFHFPKIHLALHPQIFHLPSSLQLAMSIYHLVVSLLLPFSFFNHLYLDVLCPLNLPWRLHSPFYVLLSSPDLLILACRGNYGTILSLLPD